MKNINTFSEHLKKLGITGLLFESLVDLDKTTSAIHDSIDMQKQPNGITCGPTSLNAIYNNYGKDISIDTISDDLDILNEEEGTYAQVLGIDALKRGFKCTLYSYNLDIVDPSWKECSSEKIKEKLTQRLTHEKDAITKSEIEKMIKYIEMGGEIIFRDLDKDIFEEYFSKDIPLICMLCCTYLYDCKREHTDKKGSKMDDINGDPCGHFVVAYGFDENGDILVADPDGDNPESKNQHYSVTTMKFCNAIMADKGAILAVE